jgi:hypothetical protein
MKKVAKLKYLSFQSAIQAPGILVGENSMSDSQKTPGAQMWLCTEPDCVLIEWKNQHIGVAFANLKNWVFETQPTKETTK